jgi:hypothetical protein
VAYVVPDDLIGLLDRGGKTSDRIRVIAATLPVISTTE